MSEDVEPRLGVIYPNQVRDSKHHNQAHSRVGLTEKGCLSLFDRPVPDLVVMRRRIRRKRSPVFKLYDQTNQVLSQHHKYVLR